MEPEPKFDKPKPEFYEPEPDFWGRLIRDLRAEQGVSQRELARLAKVNRMTLRKIESGTSHIDIYIYDRLIKALGHVFVLYPREGDPIVCENRSRFLGTVDDLTVNAGD